MLQRLTYLSQAQKLQVLEKLAQSDEKRRVAGPSQRLAQAIAFLEANREELAYFYPDLFAKCLSLWEELLNYPYFKKLAAGPLPPETPFRQRIWANLTRGQQLIRELQEEHERVTDEVLRGTPFPVLHPRPSLPPSPSR